MKEYLPFARRRVARILPPVADLNSGFPGLEAEMYRLVTVPAPWTTEEKWKAPLGSSRLSTQSEVDPYAPVIDPAVAAAFDEEVATMDEPENLAILVEADALDPKRLGDYIGMGLRGRWGFVGEAEATSGWWIFKAKDGALGRPNCTDVD